MMLGASLDQRNVVPNAAQIKIDGARRVGHDLADVAHGLADTVLVLDQGNAHVRIAMLAKADAR